MRRLIVNADDFGFTSGINRAIIEAHQRGVLTSATLMANGNALEDAVRLALPVPALAVGCHIVLTGGSPLLPAEEIPTLIENHHPASFRKSWAGFAAAALTAKLNPRQVEAEATAQILRLQSRGIAVSHVDTHKHVHIFPSVLQPVLQAARACGVPAIRNPFEPARSGALLAGVKLWPRWLGTQCLSVFAKKFPGMVRAAGMITTSGSFGIVATGNWNARLLRSILERVPAGTWELVCHPGYDDAELRAAPTRLWQSRRRELDLLLSAEMRSQLAAVPIELISYRDLA